MEKIEILNRFDQDNFDSPESEQEVIFVRSKWDQWADSMEFVDACREYAWGSLINKNINREECQKFCDEINKLLNGKLKITVPEHTQDHMKICEEWCSKAVKWKEKSYFYMLCWSTTA